MTSWGKAGHRTTRRLLMSREPSDALLQVCRWLIMNHTGLEDYTYLLFPTCIVGGTAPPLREWRHEHDAFGAAVTKVLGCHFECYRPGRLQRVRVCKPDDDCFQCVFLHYPVCAKALRVVADDTHRADTRLSGDKGMLAHWCDAWACFKSGAISYCRRDFPSWTVRFGTRDQVQAMLAAISRRTDDEYAGRDGHYNTIVRSAACCREDPAVLDMVLRCGYDANLDDGVVVAMVARPDARTAERLRLVLPRITTVEAIHRHCTVYVHRRRKPAKHTMPHVCDVANARGRPDLAIMVARRLLDLHLQGRCPGAPTRACLAS